MLCLISTKVIQPPYSKGKAKAPLYTVIGHIKCKGTNKQEQYKIINELFLILDIKGYHIPKFSYFSLFSYFSESNKYFRNLDKKQSPESFLTQGFTLKSGGLLLSRIALQYHRRKRA